MSPPWSSWGSSGARRWQRVARMRVGRAGCLGWNSGTDFKLVLCQNCGEYYKALAACPGLRSLNLRFCGQVTDKGLQELTACKQLQELNLYCCVEVTDAGIAKLKAALPHVNVIREPTARRSD